jgi:homocysteine S-methyltransferase
MSRYRDHLPQLNGETLLTEGGTETTMVFDQKIDLPLFATFPLLADEEGTGILRASYGPYIRVAREHGRGVVFESPTWRASSVWGEQLGYSPGELDAFNRKAITLLTSIRAEHEHEITPFVISGNIGPHSDGYNPSSMLSARDAQAYHATQIETLADTEADLISAFTLTYVDEAIGITRAARAADMPVVISFTLETDGRLPDSQSLPDAIARVDEETSGGPDYYMINCAHPSHFEHILEPGAPWLDRIGGIRPNASRKSHAELDESTELDSGNPDELGRQYEDLAKHFSNLTVLGGCCGTDHRHIDAIATSMLSAATS